MELELASSLIALLPFLLFVIILVKSQAISKSAQKYSHIPGPNKLPLIGNLHLMLRASIPHRLFTDLAAKYGALLHLQLGELHFVVISSPDLAKQVMKTHDLAFANRPPILTAEIMVYNYSDVGFAPYGDYWRNAKKIFTLELLSAKRVRSFRPIRAEENRNLATWIASREGSPVNLSERIYLSSYDVVTRVAVGAKTTDREIVVSVIKEAIKLAAAFGVADLYPSVKWLPWVTGVQFKLLRMRRRIDTVMGSIIEKHRRDKQDGDSLELMADVLLKSQEDGTLTDDNIKALLLGTFLAASDTSSTVVEWTMSHMIKNTRVMKKAQDEVRKVFDGSDGYIDEEKFHELEYLKLVVKEALRLHPPAPLLVPRLNEEKCEINGCEIPAKTRVIINAWALGRDPKYWGDNAEDFIPERFSEKEIDYKGNNYEYIPFGSGRRFCPGISFGLANIEFTLATLLYYFDWGMPKGIKNEDLDMVEEAAATVGRKHPLHLIPTTRRPLND